MKKTFKGFTLVECLVAMAILAIAGTLMAEIYAAVATRNKFNHFNNSSLTNQMAYVEKYTHSKTVTIESTHTGTTPPSGTNSGTSAYIKITNSTTNDVYSFPVDIHVMYSRDTHDVGSNNKDGNDNAATYSPMYAEDDHNLRYKYVLGHN